MIFNATHLAAAIGTRFIGRQSLQFTKNFFGRFNDLASIADGGGGFGSGGARFG
jgi:hypothetical protein